MSLNKLTEYSAKKSSVLCVGLDSDITRIPSRFQPSSQPQLEFNKHIIEQTAEFAVSFKLNSAFYEARGAAGWGEMAATVDFLKKNYPEHFLIVDAKRADIGSTNQGYVTAFFDEIGFDAITLHPYLGKEALQPFLERKDKVCIILAKTSNPGSGEFQDRLVTNADGEQVPVWKHVAQQVHDDWDTNKNCMLVVGATYPKELAEIRAVVGEMPFLVPGVGTQGGDMKTVLQHGSFQKGQGVLINVSRDILFADSPARQAQQLDNEYKEYVRSLPI